MRSHLGKYLSVNSYGNVLCESDERDGGTRFQISIAEDGSGRWALRNESRGYFLGGTPDELKCTAKVPSSSEFWTVHLAARPQVSRVRLQNRLVGGGEEGGGWNVNGMKQNFLLGACVLHWHPDAGLIVYWSFRLKYQRFLH